MLDATAQEFTMKKSTALHADDGLDLFAFLELGNVERGWVLPWIPGICQPVEGAGQEEHVWRVSNVGVCQEFLEEEE